MKREYSGTALDYSWKDPPWAGKGETVDVIDDRVRKAIKESDFDLDFRLTDLQYEAFEEMVERGEFTRPEIAEEIDCTVQGIRRAVDKLLDHGIVVELYREDNQQGTIHYKTLVRSISDLEPPDWQFVPSDVDMLKLAPSWRDVLIYASKYPANSQREIAMECDVGQKTVSRVFRECGDPRVESEVRNRKRAMRVSGKAMNELKEYKKKHGMSYGEAILHLLNEQKNRSSEST